MNARHERAVASFDESAISTPRGMWLPCCVRAFYSLSATSLMVGRAVEFSQHQRSSTCARQQRTERIPRKIMPLYFSYAFARMYAQSWSISASESTSFHGGIWFLPSRTVVPNFARSLAVNRRRFGN